MCSDEVQTLRRIASQRVCVAPLSVAQLINSVPSVTLNAAPAAMQAVCFGKIGRCASRATPASNCAALIIKHFAHHKQQTTADKSEIDPPRNKAKLSPCGLPTPPATFCRHRFVSFCAENVFDVWQAARHFIKRFGVARHNNQQVSSAVGLPRIHNILLNPRVLAPKITCVRCPNCWRKSCQVGTWAVAAQFKFEDCPSQIPLPRPLM